MTREDEALGKDTAEVAIISWRGDMLTLWAAEQRTDRGLYLGARKEKGKKLHLRL